MAIKIFDILAALAMVLMAVTKIEEEKWMVFLAGMAVCIAVMSAAESSKFVKGDL